MGLFANEDGSQPPARSRWTNERGTTKLVAGFIGLLVLWFGSGFVRSEILLSRNWPALSPDSEGLSVVGTLDYKGDYDRNLFRIVQANQTSRVELTDAGWRSIFDPKNGELFSDNVANTIQYARSIDSDAGDTMLQPYLKCAIARELHDANWATIVRRDYPLELPRTHGKVTTNEHTTLGALLTKFGERGKSGADLPESDSTEGGSLSGRAVDHGITVPADSLIAACPTVLVGSDFTGATLEEQPETVFGGKTYTVHLDLSPEGRSRFFQWSSKHERESLVFVLRHRVATAGRVAQAMDVNDWGVGPLHDREMAQKIVDYVNNQAQK